MRKKLTALFLILLFAHSSGAWAASPDDALPGRQSSTFRLKLRLDNPESLKSVFNHPLLTLYSDVMYALNLALQMEPTSVMFVVGKDGEQTFLQMAVLMPETALPTLNSIERGDAAETELTALLAGEAGALSEGDNGPYYFFKNTVFLAARENMILIALSIEDLNASLAALDKAGVCRIA